jgi:hypothetical protein
MFYPFLPGKYDGLAVPLSTMAQLFGAAGLLLVPIGVLWLVYEVRKRAQKNRNLPNTGRGYYFAMVSLIAASFVVIAGSFVILVVIGVSFGVLAFALGFYAMSRLIPRLKLLKKAEAENINPAPFYIVFIPLAILLLQITLAGPATEFSRNYAITKSAELINEIEKHHARYGRYPSSLLAVNKDYHPSVVGIEQFHYAPNGDAYNLFFEQPTFLFDDLGTREFVMYNKLDEHIMLSHAAWLLVWSPEELAARQGWYAAHDASSPHWKYFWFD